MDPERWQQIEQIYNQALELEPGRRRAFLEEAGADDESLRKEVERLLACQSEAERFIESPAIEMAAQVLGEDRNSEPHADLVGHTLLHYHIVEKTGEGGMGIVYKGRTGNLARRFASSLPRGVTGSQPSHRTGRGLLLLQTGRGPTGESGSATATVQILCHPIAREAAQNGPPTVRALFLTTSSAPRFVRKSRASIS